MMFGAANLDATGSASNNMLTGDAGNSRATEALAPTPRMAARVPTSTR